MGRWIARLAARLLKSTRLDNESRQLLTAAILDGIHALPLRARIVIDGAGMVYVDGKPVSAPQLIALRESAAAMTENYALRFVREQVRFLAVEKGVHQNLTPEHGLFAKAALWAIHEEDTLYRKLAGTGVE